MSELKQGDTVWFVNDELKLEKVHLWADNKESGLLFVYSYDWNKMTTDEIGDYGIYSHCSQNQWRPTLAEAQKLLVRKIWDKKKELEEQIEELDEKMADLLDEMYPE